MPGAYTPRHWLLLTCLGRVRQAAFLLPITVFRWRQSIRLGVSVHADSSPMPPDMVAVGSTILGPNYSTNSQIADRNTIPLPMWKPRSGRGATFVLWEDALHDVLQKLGLCVATVFTSCRAGQAVLAHAVRRVVGAVPRRERSYSSTRCVHRSIWTGRMWLRTSGSSRSGRTSTAARMAGRWCAGLCLSPIARPSRADGPN